MACQCAPALLKLRDEIDDRWPGRDKASDGCCASAKHSTQNPTSDHEPTNGYAHAIDIDEDLDAATHSLAFLVPTLLADSRTRYVIYERLIHYPGGVSKPYSGVNPHDKHLHLSIKATATFETRPWLTPGPLNEAPPAPQEDEMQEADFERIQKMIDAAVKTVALEVQKVPRWVGGVDVAADEWPTVDDAIQEVRKVPGWVDDAIDDG